MNIVSGSLQHSREHCNSRRGSRGIGRSREVIVIRQRRAEWEQRLPEVRAILERGTAEARRVGEQTMQEVRRAMRIDYFD